MRRNKGSNVTEKVAFNLQEMTHGAKVIDGKKFSPRASEKELKEWAKRVVANENKRIGVSKAAVAKWEINGNFGNYQALKEHSLGAFFLAISSSNPLRTWRLRVIIYNYACLHFVCHRPASRKYLDCTLGIFKVSGAGVLEKKFYGKSLKHKNFKRSFSE
ncbi:MAG: hypothetical protein J6Z22_09890 [Lachnospiraceae bacterium]|nr:hypothetical protein [Lachnospiraceae bacterium]